MQITMDGKYQTRDGRPVRLLCIDGPTPNYPVVGIVEGAVHVSTWMDTGKYHNSSENSRDLVPIPAPPRMIPLGPEDVVPGSVFSDSERTKEKAWYPPLRVLPKGVVLPFPDDDGGTEFELINFVQLQSYLIKRPGEEWQRCEKPER